MDVELSSDKPEKAIGLIEGYMVVLYLKGSHHFVSVYTNSGGASYNNATGLSDPTHLKDYIEFAKVNGRFFLRVSYIFRNLEEATITKTIYNYER
jgi:hypothetical protein